MGKSVLVTREGYNKLVEDFQRMRGDDMREALQNLTDAREKGDISENTEYEVAKQLLDELHEKIKKVGETLNKVRIIESVLDDGTVQLLTYVKIKNLKTNKEVEYKIVPENESAIKENKISSESAIGKALMNKRVGQRVEVNVPAGKLEFELLNIRCL